MNRIVRWAVISWLVIIVSPSWCEPATAKPNLGKKLLGTAMQGEAAEAQALLDQGADPNYADKEGCTPLIVAAGGCSFAVDVGGGGRYSLTPAASRGTFEMVRALLRAGASPDVCDLKNRTALMYACKWGRTESVHALLDARANPNPNGVD